MSDIATTIRSDATGLKSTIATTKGPFVTASQINRAGMPARAAMGNKGPRHDR
ncbi:MAG: hypothetical protein KF859_05350 [Phycisphaeraceae bacterium]|nr:hypothetical protein [Phycisphaeraceae bacterium]